MSKYIKGIRRFKMIMLEHAIDRNILKKYNNFFSDVNDVKTNLKQLKILIFDFLEEIKKLNIFDIVVTEKSDNLYRYRCNYSSCVQFMISDILKFLDDNNNDKFDKIVFPEGDNIIKDNLFVKIEIETNNFNRIHINEIPIIIKGIGVGKKVYKSMIEKLNYVSSIGEDRTIDAELILDSILYDIDIYSFVCDEKIISFSKKYSYDNIISTVIKYFEYELNNNYKVIIDSNFRKKYNIEYDFLNDFVKK